MRPALVVRLRVQDDEWDLAPPESCQRRSIEPARPGRDERNIHRAGVDRCLELGWLQAVVGECEARLLHPRYQQLRRAMRADHDGQTRSVHCPPPAVGLDCKAGRTATSASPEASIWTKPTACPSSTSNSIQASFPVGRCAVESKLPLVEATPTSW